MKEITVGVEGMMCGMCEAHVNEKIRGAFMVEKVSSSHTKNQTVILAKEELSEEKIRDIISGMGYTVTSYEVKESEKKGLFSFLK